MRSENQVRAMLLRFHKFEKDGGHMIEEMNGEIAALEYVLEKRDDLI